MVNKNSIIFSPLPALPHNILCLNSFFVTRDFNFHKYAGLCHIYSDHSLIIATHFDEWLCYIQTNDTYKSN